MTDSPQTVKRSRGGCSTVVFVQASAAADGLQTGLHLESHNRTTLLEPVLTCTCPHGL